MLAIHWKRGVMRDELLKRVSHVSLIDALMLGDDEMALRLLKSGEIMLQHPMPNGATMLHFARTRGVAERLLELGVPVDAPDKHGRTPIMLAAEKRLPELMSFLAGRGAVTTPELDARLGDLPGLKKALGRKKPGPSLIVAAVEGQQVEMVHWLLRRGVDPNTRNTRGSKGTLLHSAAWNGNLELVKLLIAAGAENDAIDEEYNTTPLAWARTARQYTGNADCEAVIAYLETH
jgi:ankyrin repeat protein